MTPLSLDHVQLAIPAGAELAADAFYVDLLGLERLEKPESLARRGGRWYQAGERQVHLGVDPDFRPATKARVAFSVTGYDDLLVKLGDAGHTCVGDTELEGVTRCYVNDPFGNRLELIKRS